MIDPAHAYEPRVWQLSDGAFRLYFSSICYCVSYMTGGKLDELALSALRIREKQKAELFRVGLWQQVGDHVVVPYQARREAVRREEEARRKAGRERVDRHRHPERYVTPNVTPDVTPAVTGYVTPDVTRSVTLALPHTPSELTLSDSTSFPDLPVCPPEKLTGRARARTKSKPRTGFPNDFDPTAAHRTRAHETGLNLPWEVQKFKAHHIAKGSLMADWNAAFTTWLMNATEYSGRNGKAPGAIVHEAQQASERPERRELRGGGELKPIDPQAALQALRAVQGQR